MAETNMTEMERPEVETEAAQSGNGIEEEDPMEGFRRLGRMELLGKMAAELPDIRKAVGISETGVAEKIGMEEEKYRAVENGMRDLQWPEYMSLVFLFWNNETGRGLLDEKGLFPDAMKKAFSINRNAHPLAGGREKA